MSEHTPPLTNPVDQARARALFVSTAFSTVAVFAIACAHQDWLCAGAWLGSVSLAALTIRAGIRLREQEFDAIDESLERIKDTLARPAADCLPSTGDKCEVCSERTATLVVSGVPDHIGFNCLCCDICSLQFRHSDSRPITR